MGFLFKLILRFALLVGTLYILAAYIESFRITGGISSVAFIAFVLLILTTFLKPILKLLTFPFVWLTFGLFNIVINIGLLWVADYFLPMLDITKISTLFWVSFITGIVSSLI